MSKIGWAIAAALALTMLFSSPAPAAVTCDRNVAIGGSVANAVNSAPDGSTICLAGGVHTQSPSITDGSTAAAGSKRIRSRPGQVATIRGRIQIKDGADYVVVSDLVLDGTGISLPSPQVNGDHVWLLRNNITNGHTGICLSLSSSPEYGRAQHVVVRRNVIHDCGKLPQENHHHGVYASAYDVVIEWNLIVDNADRGVQLYSSGQRQLVRHNIIWGNGQGGNFSGSTRDSVFEHNVIGHSVGHQGSGLAGGWNLYDWSTSSSAANVLRENCLYADNADPRYNVDGGVDHGNFAEVGNRVFRSSPLDENFVITDPRCRELVGDPISVIGRWPQGPPM